MPSIKQKIHGFTLIEIQIALLLLVLIMGLMFGALYMGSKSWKKGQAQNELIEEKRLVSEFLRKQISQIIPILWTNNRGSDLVFRGNPDSMLFVGRLPANRLSGLPSLLQIVTKKDDTGIRLEFGYSTLTPDQTPFDTRGDRMQTTPLLDKIDSIDFQYFGQQRPGTKPPQWYPNWESRKLLPRLIKCQISLTDGAVWPEMIFPLHVDNTSSFRQFFLQESRNYQFNRSGKDTKKSTGPSINLDDLF